MANVPEGARLSDDGHWWWDEEGQQWQPVQNETVSTEAAGTADGAEAAGGDRAAARVAAGLPAALDDVTDEQRDQYLDEPTVAVEAVDVDEVEVLAMQDSGGEQGEALA